MSIHRTAADALRNRRGEFAEAVVALLYERQPDVWSAYGNKGRTLCIRDAGYHLTYLAEAVEAEDPALFTEYLSWVQVLFSNLRLPSDTIDVTLECTRTVLEKFLPEECYLAVSPILTAGLDALPMVGQEPPSFVQNSNPLADTARRYLEALLAGDRHTAGRLILDAVQRGTPVKQIYLHVFQPVQREIGRLWQTNRISVAQEHFCTAATQTIMSQLYPYIFTGERRQRRLVACCVGGELHEIGARMVADFMEMDGWDTYFMGANTPTESILKTLQEQHADVLAVSATMTFHVSLVADLIRQVRESRLADTPVLVGGYPFNISKNLWRKIGADGWAPDAEGAAELAQKVIAV